ncbi:MAG: SpoIIIAH-like family protein [Clostridia bacterium]|nr:SpoIIIAH-like family protein [Clostridia bacterium]
MSKKKKIIILSSMIALLAVTAVFNFVLSGTNNVTDATDASYFSEYKAERSSSRNEQILQLDKIIAESDENSEVRETALTQKLQLTALTEQELRMESLIKAYGYEEVVVTMNLNSPNVNVVVKDAEFDQTDAVKIYSILTQENSIDAENINIIPYL